MPEEITKPVPVEDDHDEEVDDEIEEMITPGAAGAGASASKKKKKSKKKKSATTTATTTTDSQPSSSATTNIVAPADPPTAPTPDINALKGLLDKLNLLSQPGPSTYKQPKEMEDHKFWSTQPVPKSNEVVLSDGVIEEDKAISDIRQQPYELNSQFEWSIIDIEDDQQIKEVYELLSLNYVEDDDAMFRFDYSAAFLKWALQPPGWKQVWHLGVRVASNKKLVAFISGIPADLRIHSATKRLVEINFLCVHKKLRSKRLAPLLIKEITRLVNLTGIFQAVYTAGAVLPKAIATCRYNHRLLNPKKLIETGFSRLPAKLTMAGVIKLYSLPTEPSIPGTRIMKDSDVPQVTALLRKYLLKFDVAPVLSEADVRHWLLPIKDVVFSYVVEDPEDGNKITDFYSFYSLPSSVINNPKHSHLQAAYLFYYVPKGMGSDEGRLNAIIKDALIFAKKACHLNSFDVFNCLDMMENKKFLQELKFGKGDGDLHYYLYNYRCTPIKPEGMGLVLL
ncbi:Glycylpeptide N-tetradecanoyltransferase 2 [Blyttiomyces sp. JEL0837]|nr:Glycylpeptide N-tetradecanoyltransferase 2 [Blyttiomyces sp. JEL0837]